MKVPKFFISFILLIMLAFTGNAFATITSVEDVYTTDANTITGQSFNGQAYVVSEDYNDHSHLIPYASHDGWAIVNANYNYFDKVVHVNAAGQYELIFSVKNTTPYTWSDYHFVFGSNVSGITWASIPGVNTGLSGNELSFWANNWVKNGDTVLFDITLTTSAVAGNSDFTIRQVATTVPVPAALWLFGPGLAGLAALRRKLKA